MYPRAVFDRLFDTSGLLRDKSVLDAVLSQSKDLRRNLGGQDQQKLDEFMTSVRDLETRIERATREERLEGWRPSLAKPDMERPAAELPQDVREHMRMMLDLILLAWRMDKTRVATLIFNRDVSHMKFGFLDGILNDQLHGISHHKEDPKKLASYQRINQFHVEQLAYLMGRMRQIDEGGGTTMLDNVQWRQPRRAQSPHDPRRPRRRQHRWRPSHRHCSEVRGAATRLQSLPRHSPSHGTHNRPLRR